MFTDAGSFQQQVIARQIADKSNQGRAQTEFISTVVKEFEGSEKRQMMDVSQRYYENKNDILQAKRMVIGRDPETNAAILMESKVLSNNKLAHNFMKKLTRQKIGYMLSKKFSMLKLKDKDPVAEEMFDAVQEYFDESFYKMLKNVGRDSIVKILGWLMVYYDEEGQLKFKRINPEEAIPLWADSDHTILDAFIRKYTIEEYIEGKKLYHQFVDYYTLDGIYHYKYNDNGVLEPLPDDLFFEYNFGIKGKDADGNDATIGVNWAKIPFVPFKYDPDEQGLLSRIKSLIDDYDKKSSGVSNNIDDFPNSMLVIKNYDGASKEEFVHNKNAFRSIFVQGDGDARVLEQPLDVQSVDKHLDRLRQDIYEFGQGVNTADKDIRDTSGVALRFLYADLDMDCLDWGAEFRWSLKELIWFIHQDILSKTGKDYTKVKYDIIFNTDIIVNESETIQNAFNSVGVISPETIAANHPWTLDAKKEVDGMLGNKEDILGLEAEYGNSASNPLDGQRGPKQ